MNFDEAADEGYGFDPVTIMAAIGLGTKAVGGVVQAFKKPVPKKASVTAAPVVVRRAVTSDPSSSLTTPVIIGIAGVAVIGIILMLRGTKE